MKNEERVWLIRHYDRSFSRPLTEAELMEAFSKGGMNRMDELCASTGYWFSIQDVKEMRKHFGDMSLEGIFTRQMEDVTGEQQESTAKISIPAKHMEELQKQAGQNSAISPQPVTPPKPLIPDQSPAKADPASMVKNVIMVVLSVLVLILALLLFV